MLPVGVPEERLKNLSCLSPSSCFLIYFVLSALNSPPSLPPPPTPPLPFSLHVPLFAIALPFLTPSTRFSPSLTTRHQPRLPPLPSQSTCATRRCSCARTAGRATRTRSACALRSSRGCCANTRAARRGKSATPPRPHASMWPRCCSAPCWPTCCPH